MSTPKSPGAQKIARETVSERICQNFFSGIPGGKLEQLANAAPVLLEACKELLIELGMQDGTIIPADAPVCIKARAAISLAEKP